MYIYIYNFYSFMYSKMGKTSKQLTSNWKTTSKLLSFNWLYQKQNDIDKLTIEQKFIYENQKRDLKKASKQKLSIDIFAKELVFYDLLTKENKVNKKILQLDIQKKKEKLCKSFINEFYFQNTPKEKNYEKLLIEKLTNQIIIEYIKNSYSQNDKLDIENIENILIELENIKEDFRKIWFENIDDVKKQKDIIKDYRKTYQKLIQKQLKARYRLAKKYNFLYV